MGVILLLWKVIILNLKFSKFIYIIVYSIITKWAKEKWISKPKWLMTKPILFFSQFLFQNLWSNLLRLCQAKVGRLAETVSWCPCALSLAHCPGQCGPELSMHMPWVVAQMVRILPAMWETRVQSLGWEDTLEKRMANHSIILAWRIPWTEEPGGLQSIGSQRVRHDWVTNTFTFFSCHESQRAYLWLTCHELTVCVTDKGSWGHHVTMLMISYHLHSKNIMQEIYFTY